ncbi:MAG: hypothetical protein HYS88_00050, partial [Candidatus Colwellbacteria bacterium]|nr:hypothetical protein [Candidatus Colwellbacteria bacterium]
MRYYALSEQRVRRVLKTPSRIEEGIAEGTIALMQRAGSKKHPYEIWVMVADEKTRRKIISAWRYPGLTQPSESLPDTILKEFREAGYGI